MAAASSYVLQGAYVSPWSGPGTLGVTNLDTSGKVVTVTTVGAAMTPGETYTLAAYGDAVTIDLGTVASFSIAASAYPATILLLVTPVSGVPVVTANPAVGSTVGRRYLGKVTITANAQGAASGTFAFTAQIGDRFVAVIPTGVIPWASIAGTEVATTNDPAVSPAIVTATGEGRGPYLMLPLIPDLTLDWAVEFSTSSAAPGDAWTFYLFAEQGPSVVQVEAGLSAIPANITMVNGSPGNGQATMLDSLPVVIASDQSPVSVHVAARVPTVRLAANQSNTTTGVTVGTIAAQGAGVDLYVFTGWSLSASCRGTVLAAGAVQLSLSVSDGTRTVEMGIGNSQPGVPLNIGETMPAGLDLGAYLDTTQPWTVAVNLSTLWGTPGSVDYHAEVYYTTRRP